MPLLHSRLNFAPAEVDVETRADGSLVLRSPQRLHETARHVSDWLRRWAAEAPERCFLAERQGTGQGDGWRRLSYAQTLEAAQRIGQALLDRGLDAGRPVAVLSDNSIDHALLALGAMHAGVPIMPISPAYSLNSTDFGKLRQIVALTTPGLVHADPQPRYARALQAIGMASTPVSELLGATPGPAIERAHAAIGPDSVAKVLFTSGSTGAPKAVVNTQRMMTCNQQQSLQVWPFLGERPPVVVDWLPWNHTFGGNYNFNMVLSNGGTLYIDAGKPAPGLFDTTLRNLAEVAPTMYFNVPRGFDLLLPHLERDAALCRHFFSRCEFVFYAGAALPQNLWQRFERLALAQRGADLALVSAWGATETAPLCAAVHFAVERAGVVGLPVPGCEIKLVPSAGKFEARLRGPNVTPGYFRQPELTAQAFDDEGFYRIGDAMKLVDAAEPRRGLAFDGRVAEDFKLRTGTWVHVGALRLRLIAALDPWVQDAVITGHDDDEVGALLFASASAAALPAAELRARLAEALQRFDSAPGTASSTRVARVLLLDAPPRADLGEITDKGYVNQRAVLDARRDDVARLHRRPADTDVLVVLN